MTIAVGILTPFSIVMAADSEESTMLPGDLKSTAAKVTYAYNGYVDDTNTIRSRSIVISGAGDSAYLAALKQHVLDDFDNRSMNDPGQFDEALRRRMRLFYKQHVIPFHGFTDMDLRVNLIVGISIDGNRRLWVTNLSTVKNVPVFGSAAVGSGAKWFRTAIGQAFVINDELSVSVALAYGVFFAKEYAGGCGKQTQIVCIRYEGPPLWANQEAVERLDAVFRRYSQYERFLRNSILGIPRLETFHGNDSRLNDFSAEIEAIAHSLYPSVKPSSAPTA